MNLFPSLTMTRPPITGLVLAGGASRRMGSDKAILPIGGQRLVDRGVSTLQRFCTRIVVASGDGQRLGTLDQVADQHADGGPLAGILAGLQAIDTPLAAVLAVDLPYASADVFLHLADRWNGQLAVVARVDDHLQPLHAIWSAEAAPPLRRWLASRERSVKAFLDTVDVAIIDVDDLPPEDRNGRFAVNVNSPADLLNLDAE